MKEKHQKSEKNIDQIRIVLCGMTNNKLARLKATPVQNYNPSTQLGNPVIGKMDEYPENFLNLIQI